MSGKLKIRNIRKKAMSDLNVELDKLLNEQNLSLDQLCEITDINKKVIERWKSQTGYVDLYFLCRICACFNKKLVIKFKDFTNEK
jgi:transcriptional regulator with XRE-family HTH domain